MVLAANHMKLTWFTWVTILAAIVGFFISACAGAANSAFKSVQFMFVWQALLLLAYAVGGTLILRRVHLRTPLAVGFLIGASFMLLMVLLETAAISDANVGNMGLTPRPASVSAVTAFAIILMILMIPFTAFLVLFRNTILPPPAANIDAGAIPPPAFGGAAGMPPATYSGATYDSGAYAAEPKGYGEVSGATHTPGVL